MKEFEATIKFLTTEESGRQGRPIDGYSPGLSYDGDIWIIRLNFIGTKEILPGETINSFISFLSPDQQIGKLFVGKDFDICEGSRIVAKGTITQVF